MYHFVLDSEMKEDAPGYLRREHAILKNKLGKEGTPRVYKTLIRGHNKKDVEFVTTSKDVHLEFGRMGFDGQVAFATLLEWKFNELKCTQMLVSGKVDSSAYLVTITTSSDFVTYTISPAH